MVAAATPTPRQLESWLRQRCQHMLGQDQPPRQVTVEPMGTVHLAHCDFPQARQTLVLKWSPRWSSLGGGLARLMEVHRLVRRDPDLARYTISFLDCDPLRSVLVMEAADGVTLHQLMQRCLHSGVGEHLVRGAMEQLACFLARLHQLEPQALGIEHPRKVNASFGQELLSWWREPALQRWLPAPLRDPQPFHDRMTRAFWQSDGRFLLPVDLQPKNVMVDAAGQIRVIDVDYAVGHPARSLAMLLATLDQLLLRDPFPAAVAAVQHWKSWLLEAYFQQDRRRWVATDLEFFYPWAILNYHRQHLQYRPRLGLYLDWSYARLLRRALEQCPGAQAWDGRSRSPAFNSSAAAPVGDGGG